MSLVPVELPKGYRREGPVVTVLGGDKNIDLTMAQPSPVMVHSSRVWRALKFTLKLSAVLAVFFAYPAMMWSAHDINDAPVDAVTAEAWASPSAGVAITLVAREVEGPGWTGDFPAYAPARQLTAQPAWQVALVNALADQVQLAASSVNADGSVDPDLAAASRLLRTKANVETTPRLIAAAEALARYNGRVHAGLVNDFNEPAHLSQTLLLYAAWAGESSADLSALIGHDDGWPASRADVHAFYTARARAHVVNSMLQAATHSHPDLMSRASLRAQVREAQALWHRIASQSPLIVSNQDGDGALLPNHLAAMAWHLDQAEAATLTLSELVMGAQPDMTLAEANAISLTTAP